MVRHVFFSFHYGKDNWRANVVRNSWVTNANQEAAGYVDSAEWEQIERQGDDAIRAWINEQLKNTSVTAVLIGPETYERRWVDYEIEQSYSRGNGLVGIYIHNIENKRGRTALKGRNPLSKFRDENTRERLSNMFKTYYWKRDNGKENLGKWIEEAARKAGR